MRIVGADFFLEGEGVETHCSLVSRLGPLISYIDQVHVKWHLFIALLYIRKNWEDTTKWEAEG